VSTTSVHPDLIIDLDGLDHLLRLLADDGYELVGPTVRDGAISHDTIEGLSDLPTGVGEEQAPGRYRLVERGDDAVFGFASPSDSFKHRLFPPKAHLLRIRRSDGSFVVEDGDRSVPRQAFIGVRSCDLAAIEVQDRVFMANDPPDPGYTARREAAFVVALNCGQAGGTCFCVSMGTGPDVRHPHDLALTELLEDGRHEFLVEPGSPEGAEVAARLPARPATDEDRGAARDVVETTAGQMGRVMETDGIKEALYAAQEHPRWDDVAERCLSCTNCTLACPTCFCGTLTDETSLDGDTVDRWKRWESCFTLDHSYIHGGAVRSSTRTRYRQWLTHKVASWIDQYGTSGCVGCGRCITWCPVGIDITEEVAALRRPPEVTA